MRDKNQKINIDNELNQKIISKFSDDEIKQINFSLNEMNIKFQTDNFIYHKVIHNIKNNKDFIKIYYISFIPHIDRKYGDVLNDEDNEQK